MSNYKYSKAYNKTYMNLIHYSFSTWLIQKNAQETVEKHQLMRKASTDKHQLMRKASTDKHQLIRESIDE